VVLLLADDGGVEALFDEALAEAFHGGDADLHRLGDALIGPGRSPGAGVGLEEGAGVGEFPGGGIAGGDELGQLLALRSCQRDLVLLHSGILPIPLTKQLHTHPARLP
jgi:hypothetical protein